jgi:hypothetical protein
MNPKSKTVDLRSVSAQSECTVDQTTQYGRAKKIITETAIANDIRAIGNTQDDRTDENESTHDRKANSKKCLSCERAPRLIEGFSPSRTIVLHRRGPFPAAQF